MSLDYSCLIVKNVGEYIQLIQWYISIYKVYILSIPKYSTHFINIYKGRIANNVNKNIINIFKIIIFYY